MTGQRMAYVSGRGYGKTLTQEKLKAMYEAMRVPYFRSNVLGAWEYTPAEELRDRLNIRLRGNQPPTVSNTRYWRNL